MDRRTFLASLTAIPLARLLPNLTGNGPYPFKVSFPNGATFSFSGLVIGKYGPIDLNKELPEMVTIQPVGPMTITQGMPEEIEEEWDENDEDIEDEEPPNTEASTSKERVYLSIDDARDRFEIGEVELPTLDEPFDTHVIGTFKRGMLPDKPFDPEALIGPSRGKMTFKINFLPEKD